MPTASGPLVVEVWRGAQLESRHGVDLAIIDAAGNLQLAMGDIDRPVYPRSAIKPLQALRLLRSGAVEQFGLNDEQIALACASHSGEPAHINGVTAWLQRIGLDETALLCGPHPPSNRAAADALVASSHLPSRVHNNCSGKHTGLLSAALAFDFPTAAYNDPAHPL
ncbi:MAG: asparaginase, partial [Pseudomonadota bacterium]